MNTKGEVLIQVQNLQKSFDGNVVLDGISTEIHKGEVVAIIGPSGSGKSTFLRSLNLMEEPTGGKILFENVDITDPKVDINRHRQKIGMVFQQFNLFPHKTVKQNIMMAPVALKLMTKEEASRRADELLARVGLPDKANAYPDMLSGGQKQRIAIARAIVNEPRVLLLDEPLGALDLKLRQDMQYELIRLKNELGITFIYVTHDQEEALTMSDTIVVMNQGYIQQMGSPEQIYNEPENAFVADFIGESNILNGVMIRDKFVTFAGHEFECVDEGFGEQAQVDVVIRPEDIYIFDISDAAQLTGTVTSCIFKGVHYEMLIQTREGYELMVQDYHCFEAGREVGLLVKPFDIHVMKKERTCNTFEGKLIDSTHVEFLGCTFECKEVQNIEPETPVRVEVDFQNIILEDNEEDGRLTGEVKFILYKGNHYHLTVFSDWDEDIFVDTNDVWDDGDRVGITIAPENIRIVQSLNKEGSDQ